MALPNNPSTKVIPGAFAEAYTDFNIFSAWYSGDIRSLHNVYAGNKNMFWARNPYENRRVSLHVPVAGDIATTSADLLFSEEPTMLVGDPKIQAKLYEIVYNTGFHSRLLGAAETCAALGGIYLKVDWDKNLSPYPLLGIAQSNTAIPEFRHGILQAVTFWKKIAEDGKNIYRILERHEKIDGTGHILYGLYVGNTDELGEKIPLSTLPETAGLVDDIDTLIDDILVRYVPNKTPNRKFIGSAIGQSDYSGVEGLMDALDETYSSWMRDIRLGQGRILVPETYLDPKPDGTVIFDMDKEAYTSYAGHPNQDNNGITLNQFDIRTDEHMKTAVALLGRIIANAGYSPQTFGLELDKVPESGKALGIRERKTSITTTKKKRYWESALEDILYLMLQVDKLHLGGSVEPMKPSVSLEDADVTDMQTLASSIQLLDAANAASIETKVRMAHNDWTDEQINAEILRIRQEKGITITES